MTQLKCLDFSLIFSGLLAWLMVFLELWWIELLAFSTTLVLLGQWDLMYQQRHITSRIKHLWRRLFTRIVNNFNTFQANIHLFYPLRTQENLCFSAVFRAYKMGISARNELKGFDIVGHVGLPHKHKSYFIFIMFGLFLMVKGF